MSRRAMLLFVVGLMIGILSNPAVRGETPKNWRPTGSVEELVRLDWLPLARPGVECRMFSSYDRTGGNNDGFNGTYSKLRLEDGNSVLADIDGPGAIHRIWMTHSEWKQDGLLARQGENILIYIDGEETPCLKAPIEDLFAGRLPAFPKPLVGEAIGGFYCYAPIAFRKGCKIVVEGDAVRFYQITYSRFPSDEGVAPFEAEPSPEVRASLERAVDVWTHPGDLNRLLAPSKQIIEVSFSPDADRNEKNRATALPTGAHMIRGIYLSVAEGERPLMDDSRIRIYWDGAAKPAVDAPIAMFFAQAYEPEPLQSLMVGATDSGWYNFHPMPYFASARMEIETSKAMRSTVKVVLQPLDNPSAELLYGHAVYNEALPTQPDVHFPFLIRSNGRGHFAGVYLATDGEDEAKLPRWLEGDDRFFVDGEIMIHGTGSEDYFNCGWYATPGRLVQAAALPLHGFPVYRQGDTPYAAAYRWHLTDPVPYASHIEAGIEHGEANRTPARYRGVSFFYDTASGAIPPMEPAKGIDHHVPANKKLDREWVEALDDPGERTWHKARDNASIGMPIGGVAAGQLYLTADGSLAEWEIFGRHVFTGYGADNYRLGRVPNQRVAHTFAIGARTVEEAVGRRLGAEDFPDTMFAGEYPMAFVKYEDQTSDFPIEVELTAFSPFIPLNEEDSALPATIMRFRVKNKTDGWAQATIAGWFQNPVMLHSDDTWLGARVNRLVQAKDDRPAMLQFAAEQIQSPTPAEPPTVFEDFEGGDYEGWTVTGDAFGDRPATGTLASQQTVTGFLGEGLVNTFRNKDLSQGKLTSQEFEIQRPFIRFLIGGGNYEGATCINLLIEGKAVRTARGESAETLKWRSWMVQDLIGQKARLEIVDNRTDGWGHINIDQIEFADSPRQSADGGFTKQPDYGTAALSVLNAPADEVIGGVTVPSVMSPQVLSGPLDPALEGDVQIEFGSEAAGAIGRQVMLEAGEEKTIDFVLTWNFPNREQGQEQHYSRHFDSAAAVAQYVAWNFERLSVETARWHETAYDSTLPHWLLDRVYSTVSILATETCQWWRNGRFWAWEGVGCCHGTCSHVWNYEHALARLFPRLERSVREMQDLNPEEGLVEETGMVRFRGKDWGNWAADGQAGTILKCYREHQISPNDEFLMRNWPFIQRVMNFLIEKDTEDGARDGMIEGQQHNTYDIDYYGPNPMMNSLYLAALRAAEQMALETGDDAYSGECRALFEMGRARASKEMFNGEYFEQIVDLKEHPQWQHGDGCLSDQLFGDSWARQVGLSDIYPRDQVRSALKAIWKYNWAPDVQPQNERHKPERWFAHYGEGGLFTCTWPKSMHLGDQSTRYRNEIWTGIEYQVASHMAWEGMTDEALAICRAIHERYDPAKRNPFNEIECGDHYSRAMASWGMLTALSGFEYHGPKKRLGFTPRISPENFRGPFTAAEAWGTLSQEVPAKDLQKNTIAVRWGQLPLQTLTIPILLTDPNAAGRETPGYSRMIVTLNEKEIPFRINDTGQIEFTPHLVIPAGDTLTVTLYGVPSR